jgi:hypothetical protein
LARHPDFRIQRLAIGAERAPLLVIDNVLPEPDTVVEIGVSKNYNDVATYYPGVRARVPLSVQQSLLEDLRSEFGGFFGLVSANLRFTSCHFSLVTAPKERLSYLQRIPHIDSVSSHELALVLYLFKADLGGTAFYRHRATGFEVVDQSRHGEYWRHVELERAAIEQAPSDYIAGDTDFYQCVARQDGVFNRMLVYRRTSLHSGALAPGFVPTPDPRKGRLSITGFIA